MAITVRYKKLKPDAITPRYAHPDDAGADVFLPETIRLAAGTRTLVDTGIALDMTSDLPLLNGYCRIAPRSGLSAKGIDIGGGVVDRSYTGPIKVLVINNSGIDLEIKKGSAIAQLIFEVSTQATFKETVSLPTTDRGASGFGSSDKQ